MRWNSEKNMSEKRLCEPPFQCFKTCYAEMISGNFPPNYNHDTFNPPTILRKLFT